MKVKANIEISINQKDRELKGLINLSLLRKKAYKITCFDSNLIMLEKINNNIYTGIEILEKEERIKKYILDNFEKY